MHACLDQHTGIKSALHQAHTKVIRLRWHRTYNLMSRMQNISSSHSQSQEETEPCCNETHAAERGQLGVGPVLSEGCCVAASREQQDPCCGAGSHQRSASLPGVQLPAAGCEASGTCSLCQRPARAQASGWLNAITFACMIGSSTKGLHGTPCMLWATGSGRRSGQVKGGQLLKLREGTP